MAPLCVLNIEVESHQHCYPTKRRFSFLRDNYLKCKSNTDVVRVDHLSSNIDQSLAAVVKLVDEKMKSV